MHSEAQIRSFSCQVSGIASISQKLCVRFVGYADPLWDQLENRTADWKFGMHTDEHLRDFLTFYSNGFDHLEL